MAMSHETCTHPRTPAGRAACRKAGGPQAAAAAPVVVTVPDTKPTRKASQRTAQTPRQRSVTPDDERAYIEARKEEIIKVTNDTPAKRGRKSKVAPIAGEMQEGLFGPRMRTRAIKAEHDMADVPHVFGAVIRLAWERDWAVRTGDPFNDTERRIEIKTTLGTASLVWKATNPNGVTGQFWRPVNTSITTRVASVNDVIRKLEGE